MPVLSEDLSCFQLRSSAARQFAQVVAERLHRVPSSKFQYLDLDRSAVLYVMGSVAVIGMPDNGVYEWVHRLEGDFHGDARERWANSDCGYGCPQSAMRDGLSVALGHTEVVCTF